MPDLPPIDLNNNPHLRGANERFLSGGENPRFTDLRTYKIKRPVEGNEWDSATYARSAKRQRDDAHHMRTEARLYTSDQLADARSRYQMIESETRSASEQVDIRDPPPENLDPSWRSAFGIPSWFK